MTVTNVMLSCRYVTDNKRIDFKDVTKLNMEAAEEKRYMQERRSSQEGASSSDQSGAASPGRAGNSPSYHFICECFFLTAKSLHLGLIKAITEAAEVYKVSNLTL